MVTLQCTHHDLSVNNGNAVLVELMHADAVMNELMDALHTINNCPVTEDSAHRSRTSGGDSGGVHRVSGSLWRRLSAIMDSGSAECVATDSIAKDGKLGRHVKNSVPHCRRRCLTMYSEIGDWYRARYQITDVTQRLNSASRVCDQGRNNVLFTKTGGCIIHHETGRCGWFPQKKTERMCCTHV